MASTDRREAPWPEEVPRQRRLFPWPGHEPRQRRRTRWSEFRQAYPRIVTAMALGLVALAALDLFLLYKVWDYRTEIRRDREAMTATERERADALTASEANRAQLQAAMVRQQAVKDTGLNLSVQLEEGTMDLQREGAELRSMKVQVGPEATVGEPPGARKITPPLGKRQVAAVVDASYEWEAPRWLLEQRGRAAAGGRRFKGGLGEIAVLLDDGTVIYSMPKEGPLADESYVMPGGVRARAEDLKAIRPNLSTGVPVYFH